MVQLTFMSLHPAWIFTTGIIMVFMITMVITPTDIGIDLIHTGGDTITHTDIIIGDTIIHTDIITGDITHTDIGTTIDIGGTKEGSQFR